MKKSIMERIFLGILFAFCLFYSITSITFDIGTFRQPGAGLVPLIMGIAASIISGIYLVQAFLGGSQEILEEFTGEGIKKLLIYVGAIIFIVVFFSILGPIAMFLGIATLAKISGFINWKKPFLISGCFTTLTYLLFYNLLLIPLPLGIIEKVWVN